MVWGTEGSDSFQILIPLPTRSLQALDPDASSGLRLSVSLSVSSCAELSSKAVALWGYVPGPFVRLLPGIPFKAQEPGPCAF